MIMDFDGTIVDPRSEDVFEILQGDLEKFFLYEKRMLLEVPGHGLWAWVLSGTHQAFEAVDVVTNRSSGLEIRVKFFFLEEGLRFRWGIFCGHQSKAGGYRIIMERLRDQPDYHVIMSDNSAKNVADFEAVSQELNMENRTTGILCPTIRQYTKKQLQTHVERVLSLKGDGILKIPDDCRPGQQTIVAMDELYCLRKIAQDLRDYAQAQQ
jgi:hypothetical protein